jgi:flagellar assembly protein FliH
LELAAGSPSVRLHLNPEDHKTLGTRVRSLIDAMSGLGDAEVMADAAIGRGGCRVETRFGTIDQQFESQLQRIEEELTG